MEVLHELEQLAAQAAAALEQARTHDEVERCRVVYLGRKSRLAEILKALSGLPTDTRAAVGKRANELKAALEVRVAVRRDQLAAAPARPALDVTLPGAAIPHGRLHPITTTMGEILARFTSWGFEIVEGPELEFEGYNFDGLNIPRDHPSRESFDTFFVELPSPDPKKGRRLLRSHTSPVQIRVMERRRPPLRIVVPGKVFRPDALDAGHSFMFHQVERAHGG